MTAFDVRWFQTTSDDTIWHHIREHQMTDDDRWCQQMVSEFIKLASSEFVQESLDILEYWNIEALEYWDNELLRECNIKIIKYGDVGIVIVISS